jgi:hypothetical protein
VEWHPVDYTDYADYSDDVDRIDYANDIKNRYTLLRKVFPSQLAACSIEKFLTPEEALSKGRDEADFDKEADHCLRCREHDQRIVQRGVFSKTREETASVE